MQLFGAEPAAALAAQLEAAVRENRIDGMEQQLVLLCAEVDNVVRALQQVVVAPTQ